MNVKANYLFRMFLDHDVTPRTSVSYDFFKLIANRKITLLWTHYSNAHLVILHNKIDKLRLEFYVIIVLLDHHNNASIVFFYTGRSAQLNKRMHA